LLLLLLWHLSGLFSRAHEGPPFPIVVDKNAGPYIVSVWTDPDVGTGTFFVILESATGTTLSDEIEVEVCVRPKTGRLQEKCYAGTRQNMRQVQYLAEVDFDQQEMWDVRVKIHGPEGSAEVLSEVEATLPGFGRWDLLLYGFPFILIGALWIHATLRRRRENQVAVPAQPVQKDISEPRP
jgi:hypothetical protein